MQNYDFIIDWCFKTVNTDYALKRVREKRNLFLSCTPDPGVDYNLFYLSHYTTEQSQKIKYFQNRWYVLSEAQD